MSGFVTTDPSIKPTISEVVSVKI